MSTASLTADDLEFLRRPLHGFLTVADGPQPPQPRPVWYEATDEGTIQMFTLTESAKVRRLQRDPRASLVVAAPVDERERWVAISGEVTFEPDGADELAKRLAVHYWGSEHEARAADLADMLAAGLLRFTLHPKTVSRYVN